MRLQDKERRFLGAFPYVRPVASAHLRHNGGGTDVFDSVLRTRQLGTLGPPEATEALLAERLYKNMGKLDVIEDDAHITGGIFNLEFNSDGSMLAAACEKKNVIIFDPGTHKVIKSIEKAHQDCVNVVKFLDTRTFATCSDDTTVALWDARNLKSRVRTLRGHSNWVKNIEYSRTERLLVTSGFDGAVYLWDINGNDDAKKIFYSSGLMRMRLAPGGDRMVISTMTGYLMVVHDLCLKTMELDLKNFKPNMYRLMQMSAQPFASAASFTRLFHARRNRVEFIVDFPGENDAEIISSLKIHPQGWVAASRNVSSDEASEWCCVHDIHAGPACSEDEDELLSDKTESTTPTGQFPTEEPRQPLQPLPPQQQPSTSSRRGGSLTVLANYIRDTSAPSPPPPPPSAAAAAAAAAAVAAAAATVAPPESQDEESDDDDDDDDESGGVSIDVDQRDERGRPIYRIRSSQIASQSRAYLNAILRRGLVTRRQEQHEEEGESGGRVILFSHANNWIYLGHTRETPPPGDVPPGARVHHNNSRLSHYLKESNTGRGYIKEVSFSPDGRLLCSPCGRGLRLLAFNERCDDLSGCVPEAPKQLCVVSAFEDCHREAVLSSSFAPYGFSLVTGCLGGKIVWHQPIV